MIDIIPAIDLIDGHAVRLTRGDYGKKKVYDSDPVSVALRFADMGISRLHMVDLDGAKVSRPCNLNVLESVAASLSIEIEWGGGICSSESLSDVFEAGATHAVIGSIAVNAPHLMDSWISEYGEKIILGADIRDGDVAVKGWTETTSVSASELIGRFVRKGLQTVICTDISRDGMLEGPSFELYKSLIDDYPQIKLIASGGVSSMNDLRLLDSAGVHGAIVGKAIYENRITPEEISKWLQKE